jgi:hypothetical protein
LVLLEQAAKLQECCGVRRRFTRQIDPDKASDSLGMVSGILDAFVGEAKALLGKYMRNIRSTPSGGRSRPSLLG